MKSGIGKLGLGVGLALLLLGPSGLAEKPPPTLTEIAVVTERDSTNVNDDKLVETKVAESTNAIAITDAPTSPITEEKALPPNIHPARPLAEIIKLANSGVEEHVMMAYVTNSTRTFNLNAEEIIYLKDIGVPDRVVTAMILRDQTLRVDSMTALAAATPPPPSETPVAPDAPEVAPQADSMVAQYPPEPMTTPTEVADDAEFYNALSPYGNWVNVAGYGACWQPTAVVVNPGWAPYYNCGRWVWTDCGWYWCSDYSWGWAPFHYGRWFCHSHLGWCWAPDKIWGPSWVSWRYTDSHCGWAPLPPGTHYAAGAGLMFHGRHVAHSQDLGLGARSYHFVSWNHFRERDFQHYRVPPQQHDQLFKHSVVATSFSGDSQKIVNDGLPPQKVASATGTQVRRVAIREAPVTVRNLGGAEHFDANARTVTIYRPNFVASSSVSTKGFGSSLTPKAPATLGSTVTTVPARVTSNHDEPGTVSAGPSASQPSARSPQSAPLILRGPQPSGVRETPPARSLVVIGRKDPNGTQTTYRTMLPSAASREAPVATAAEPARTSSGLAAPSATPWAENNVVRETPNPIWQQSPAMNPGYRPPVYVPRNNNNPIYGYERPGNSYRPVTPAYQPPARSAPAEVPRYTPPAANNNVQRSYSPPPAAAPPAPAAPSAPSQSGSGGRNQR